MLNKWRRFVPLITCEITFGQYVCELMFGVDVPDLNLGMQINSIKQPIKRNSVGSWHVSHCWTSAFDYHLDHGFIVHKDIQHSTKSRRSHVRRNVINIIQIQIDVHGWILVFHVKVLLRNKFPCDSWPLDLLIWFGEEWNTAITKSERSRAGIPSMRKPASREIISASVELCETDVCFLHIQFLGRNVWLSNMHKSTPDVDFESSRSPAKSESWNSPKSTLLCSVTHMTILSEFTCVMNVRDQARQTFVTSFSTFCNCTGNFVYGP